MLINVTEQRESLSDIHNTKRERFRGKLDFYNFNVFVVRNLNEA